MHEIHPKPAERPEDQHDYSGVEYETPDDHIITAYDTPPDPPEDGNEVEAAAEEVTAVQRGQALQEVSAFMGNFLDTTHQRIADTISADPALVAMVNRRVAEGDPEYIAIERVGRQTYTRARTMGVAETVPISVAVEAETMAEAMAAHADHLAHAGLELVKEFDGPALRLVDPAAYSEALSVMQLPDDPKVQESLKDQCDKMAEDALSTARDTILNTPYSFAYYHSEGRPWINVHGFTREYPDIVPDGSVDFTRSLAEHAASIGDSFERLGAASHKTESWQQLALARTAGMEVEWAIGHQLQVLGHSYLPPGASGRLDTLGSLENASNYLNYLVNNVPNSAFTRHVAEIIMRDVERSFDTDKWHSAALALTALHQTAREFLEQQT